MANQITSPRPQGNTQTTDSQRKNAFATVATLPANSPANNAPLQAPQTLHPTPADLMNPAFLIGKEHGITLDNGDTVTPYYSVFVDGEAIKHHGVMNNYPYDVAQHLAKAHPNATIEAVAYIQTFH